MLAPSVGTTIGQKLHLPYKSNEEEAPNTACTGRLVRAAFLGLFPELQEVSVSELGSRPAASNAHRWALNCDCAAVVPHQSSPLVVRMQKHSER
jgi:hypothetical protein